MNERILKVARIWIPVAVAVTALCGLVYLVAQQSYRMSLNDPQLQLAQDVADKLVDGAKPVRLATGQLDIAKSLAPWVMVYGEDGKPLAGGITLEGTAPVLPQGVFAYAKQQGEDRISWQPRHDVRIATIVEYWRGKSGSGFVVAGRNMREVESRISTLGELVGVGWIVTLLATLAAVAGLQFVKPPAPAAPVDEE